MHLPTFKLLFTATGTFSLSLETYKDSLKENKIMLMECSEASPYVVCKNANHHYQVIIRYAGVVWLLFPIKNLYFIGVRLGEDQRTDTSKTLV